MTVLVACLLTVAAAGGPYTGLLPEAVREGRPITNIEDLRPLLDRLGGALDLPPHAGEIVVHPVPDLQSGFSLLGLLQLDGGPWDDVLMTWAHERGHGSYSRAPAVEEAKAELLRLRVLLLLADAEPAVLLRLLPELRTWQRYRADLVYPDVVPAPEGTLRLDRAYRDAAVITLALAHRSARAGSPDPLAVAYRFARDRRSGETLLTVERELDGQDRPREMLAWWAREQVLPRLRAAAPHAATDDERALHEAATLFFEAPLDEANALAAAARLQALAVTAANPDVALDAASLAMSILVDDLERPGEAAAWLERAADDTDGAVRATLLRQLGSLRESALGDRRRAARAYTAASQVAIAGTLFSDELIGLAGRVEGHGENRLAEAFRRGAPLRGRRLSDPEFPSELVRWVGILRIAGRGGLAASYVSRYAPHLRQRGPRGLLLKDRAALLAQDGRLTDAADAWKTLGGRMDGDTWVSLAGFREGHDLLEVLRSGSVRREKKQGRLAERAEAALRRAEEHLPDGFPADRAMFDRLILLARADDGAGAEALAGRLLREHPGSDLVPAVELLLIPSRSARAPGGPEPPLRRALWDWLGRHPRDPRGPAAFRRLAATYDDARLRLAFAALARARHPGSEDAVSMVSAALEEPGALPAGTDRERLAEALGRPGFPDRDAGWSLAAAGAAHADTLTVIRMAEALLLDRAFAGSERLVGGLLEREADADEGMRAALLALRAGAREGRGDLTGAAGDARDALDLVPARPLLWVALGRILLADGATAEGLDAVAEGLRRVPLDAGSGRDLLLDELRSLRRLLEALEAEVPPPDGATAEAPEPAGAAAPDPELGDAWTGVAWALLDLGRPGPAAGAAWRAELLAPDDFRPSVALALALVRTGRPAEAREAVARALTRGDEGLRERLLEEPELAPLLAPAPPSPGPAETPESPRETPPTGPETLDRQGPLTRMNVSGREIRPDP